ncbi:MAG: ABC transporter permease [Candidatus Eisenbacteria bacterium]|uniref:ABC transporter permease n=1 Tax=Eiseniibacteriota bacterium TaxID=2212470 RepID=A0A538U0M6_UNCEI|nr:MAG: ABC transporter permease [Candidatus Eisenbacteria bacterium]
MIAYLVRRLSWSVLVLIVVAATTFAIFFAIPANPAALIAGKYASPQTIAAIEKRLGLDQPKPIQFLRFLGRAARGDLGESYASQQPVARAIATAFPKTLSLTLGAMVVWLLIGIPLGVLGALKPRSLWDRAGALFALFGISAPAYWLGLVFLKVFADALGWFPLGDYAEIKEAGIVGWASHLALPWMTLALLYAGWYARMTRSQMMEVMRQDHVRTAWAKGLRPADVTRRHVWRNALLPIVTMLGADVAGLMGGAVLTETVYGIPGVGGLAWKAIRQRDLPMVMGSVLFAAAFIVLANLVVDLAYTALDPRIRTEGREA